MSRMTCVRILARTEAWCMGQSGIDVNNCLCQPEEFMHWLSIYHGELCMPAVQGIAPADTGRRMCGIGSVQSQATLDCKSSLPLQH